MNEVDGGVHRRFYRGILIGAMILFGAWPGAATAYGQAATASPQAAATTPKTCPPPPPPTNPTPSDYSLKLNKDAKGQDATYTIKYNTTRNATTGVINFGLRASTPNTLLITWNTPTGAPPAEYILVQFDVTYNGKKGHYAIAAPIHRDGDHYTIDAPRYNGFAWAMLDDINATLPSNYDASTAGTASASVDVEVTVTPVRVFLFLGQPIVLARYTATKVNGKFTIKLEQVLGNPNL